jgi:ABC-type arginine transport system permease subunit
MPTLIVPPLAAVVEVGLASLVGLLVVFLLLVSLLLAQALSNKLVPNVAEPYNRNLRLPNLVMIVVCYFVLDNGLCKSFEICFPIRRG